MCLLILLNLQYSRMFLSKQAFALAIFLGGAEETRTPDPRLAKAVLSQLSYGPLILLELCRTFRSLG